MRNMSNIAVIITKGHFLTNNYKVEFRSSKLNRRTSQFFKTYEEAVEFAHAMMKNKDFLE